MDTQINNDTREMDGIVFVNKELKNWPNYKIAMKDQSLINGFVEVFKDDPYYDVAAFVEPIPPSLQ